MENNNHKTIEMPRVQLIPNLRSDRKFPVIDGIGEPLSVLRYSRWKVWLLTIIIIMGMGIFAWILYLIASANSNSVVAQVLESIILLLVIGSSWRIIDIILFKEIKLYQDRIIKESYLLGEKEVELEKAYIDRWQSVITGLSVRIYIKKWPILKGGVYFIEGLVNAKDRKTFYSILAELSGRQVEDFTRKLIKPFEVKYAVWSEKLIKGDDKQYIGQETNFKFPTTNETEEPLFVLRYTKGNICCTIVLGIVFFGTFTIFAFSTKELGAEIISILLIAVGIRGSINLFLLKGIELYKDRIVMSWHFNKPKEVKIEDAYIIKYPSTILSPMGEIQIFSRKVRFAFLRSGDITIDEGLSNPKDIQRFYSILAELSGRDVKDFKYGMNSKLIKEDDKQ